MIGFADITKLFPRVNDMPVGVERAFALRAALRALPAMGAPVRARINRTDQKAYDILSVFRAFGSSWAAIVRRDAHSRSVAEAAFHVVDTISKQAYRSKTEQVLSDREYAIYNRIVVIGLRLSQVAANEYHGNRLASAVLQDAGMALLDASNAYSQGHRDRTAQQSFRLAEDANSAAIESDLAAIGAGATPEQLLSRKLWPEGMPPWMRHWWNRLLSDLDVLKQDWEPWLDWYEAMLTGRPIDQQMVEAILAITEGMWEEGPNVVNPELKRRVVQNSGRVGGGRSANQSLESQKGTSGKQKKERAIVLDADGNLEKRPHLIARPKTPIGKALAANGHQIKVLSAATIVLIDDRLTRLVNEPPANDPDTINLHKIEIAQLQDIKSSLIEIDGSSTKFNNGDIDEIDAIKNTKSFSGFVEKWWQKNHIAICNKAFDMSLFLSSVGICWAAGVPHLSVIGGVLVGGKEVVEALKTHSKSIKNK